MKICGVAHNEKINILPTGSEYRIVMCNLLNLKYEYWVLEYSR